MTKEISPHGFVGLIKQIDSVLGLNLLEKDDVDIPEEVSLLIEARQKARAEKDFSKSDSLRDEIKGLGFEVKDSKEGQTVSKI